MRSLRGRIPADAVVASALGAAALVVYALTFHRDWIYDPMRYAELAQRGPVSLLLGPQHALGNLLPLAAFRAARGVGYAGQAMPVQAAFAVVFGAVAVAAVYLAAVGLGGTRVAAAASAGTFGVTVAVWRAGGSGGVYGLALAACALGWVAAAAYVRAPGDRRAVVLGVAAGAAVASHLENVAFAAAALVLVLLVDPGKTRWRRAGLLAAGAAGVVAVVFVITAGIATGWAGADMVRWIAHPGIGGPGDRSSAVGWGIAGLFQALASHQRAFALVLLFVAAFRLVMLGARSGSGRLLALAVVVNAGGAFLLSSWYQALRIDYWGLGLVPLAVGAGAGTRAFTRRRGWVRAAAIVACVAVVAALLAWNASKEVGPNLDQSAASARAAAAIEQLVPRDALVVSSLTLAGRLADDGYDAEPGFAALSHWDAGRALPRLGVVLGAALDRRPVYVTSGAFPLTPGQARELGLRSGADVWRELRSLVRVEPVLTLPGQPEVLYVVTKD